MRYFASILIGRDVEPGISKEISSDGVAAAVNRAEFKTARSQPGRLIGEASMSVPPGELAALPSMEVSTLR